MIAYTQKELWYVLKHTLRLMAHYAELLNMHDGGQRKIPHIDVWVDRVLKLKESK